MLAKGDIWHYNQNYFTNANLWRLSMLPF